MRKEIVIAVLHSSSDFKITKNISENFEIWKLYL